MSRMPQKRLIEFDISGFAKALRAEMQKATNQLKNEMLEIARANLAAIPFKDNRVNMAHTFPTSDAARKMAVLNSIISEGFKWADQVLYAGSYTTQTRVWAGISALKGNFEDTHIGIYYEYGTGEHADPTGPMFLAGKHWNPYRPKGIRQPIVSRSRKNNNGIWTDIGGNVRKTTALVGGTRSENFLTFVGEDLEAEHWFREAFKEMQKEAAEVYKNALKKVNPLKYIKVSKELTLGRRWA